MLNCEMCNKEIDGTYGSGRFCSTKCSRGFSTKNKRKEINEKVSKKLEGSGNPSIEKKCKKCEKIFVVNYNKRNSIFCSNTCKAKGSSEETRKKISSKLTKLYSNIENRTRLKEIGRKGGFGKKGYTSKGIYYQSIFEKNVFEYLDEHNIKYEPHKNIPNSTKISDLYIIEKDLWIELDGINREKKKKWIGKDYEYWLNKLEIYKREKLNFKVAYSLDEFIEMVS